NAGCHLVASVQAALNYWQPVWVIIDGSTDGSADTLIELQKKIPGLRVIFLKKNSGKGAAILAGMRAAAQAGFQFALVMDSDGQHPADFISQFMRASESNPSAMILGVPDFGADAPVNRKHGRRVGNWWANLETFWGGINDSLFGFRVYPIQESLNALEKIRGGRRYDFDTELAVRLFWRGVHPINIKVPVRYFSAADGGISHFQYWRDNFLLIRRHVRLVLQMLPRLRRIWKLRQRARQIEKSAAPKNYC
ncbi:MAG: glycosyltransferase family 2 protein, partial [Limisphaerales bacterium]